MLATSTDAGDQGAVGVWNLASGGSVFSTTTHAQITGLQFSPDGVTLATSDRDGSIQLWHVASGELLATIAAAPSRNVAFAFAPDGKQLICVGATGVVNRCDVATGKVTALGSVAEPAIFLLEFSRRS